MPPLRSHPEIIHAQPDTEEFSGCLQGLEAGRLAVIVLTNAGNPEPEHFFASAEIHDDTVCSQVAFAAISEGLLRPPPSIFVRTYRTLDAYAAAMDINTGKPPSILEGEVESVVINPLQPVRRGWGRFFGLGKSRED